MLAQRVQQQFNESIQVMITAADSLVEVIASVGDILFNTILSNGRIFVCGDGASHANAQRFVAALVHRFQADRPSLPAFLLAADVATRSAIVADGMGTEIYSKPLKALAQSGDALVVLSHDGHSGNLLEAIAVAHQRDMTVIALTGADGGQVAAVLQDNDCEIRLPSQSASRIYEGHALALHCLCDVVDSQLFTPEEVL